MRLLDGSLAAGPQRSPSPSPTAFAGASCDTRRPTRALGLVAANGSAGTGESDTRQCKATSVEHLSSVCRASVERLQREQAAHERQPAAGVMGHGNDPQMAHNKARQHQTRNASASAGAALVVL
jgi:hypothetical protein